MKKSNGQINIEYVGRFGNNLFQYFSARIYAEKNRLNLISNFPNKDFKLLPNKHFGNNPENMNDITITDNDYNNNYDNIDFKGIGNYKWTGFHQFEKYYYKNRKKILKWIDLKKTKQYACIHIRISDFLTPIHTMVINREYYKYCINLYCKNYDKIMIIKQHSDSEFEKEYINDLIKYIKSLKKKVIYKNNNMLKDFYLLCNAELIITSNSTFSFWGSFISNAKVIAFPLTEYKIYPGNIIVNSVSGSFKSSFYKIKHNSKSIVNKTYSNKIIDYFDNKVWKNISFVNQLVGNNGVFVINLEKDTKKMEFMKSQLEKQNISFTRINATHGIKEPLEELNKYYNVGYDRTKVSNYTFGSAGCAMSHIRIWHSLKDKLINENQWALILEDDSYLPNNINKYIKEAWNLSGEQFKKNGIVYLQWCYPHNLHELIDSNEYVSIIHGGGYHGTTAYLINSIGLKRLLNIKIPFTRHLDYTILCTTNETNGAYGIRFKNINSLNILNNLKDEYKKKIINVDKKLNDGIIYGLSNVDLIKSNIKEDGDTNDSDFMDDIINEDIIKIAYVNYWGEDEQRHYLTEFIEHNIGKVKIVDKHEYPDLLISSVYGDINEIKNIKAKKKIIFIGENLERYPQYNDDKLLYNTFDLIIGFKNNNIKINQIHFPLWLFYYKYYNYNKNNNLLKYIENQYKINSNNHKPYFGSILNSHDSYNTRTPIFDELSKYGEIKSPGNYRNNMNKIGQYNKDKINFISQSKFNICAENTISNNYTTEKIFQALESGTIPIYYGYKFPEKNIINKNKYCFCDIKNKNNLKMNINHVVNNYNQYKEGNVFNKNAHLQLKKYYDNLNYNLKKLLNK